MLVAEAALYYKQIEKLNLLQVLNKIYEKYGYYLEDQTSITLKGIEGKKEMAEIMTGLRGADIHSIAGIPLERIDDYELRIGKRLKEDTIKEKYALTLPKSQVIRYSFVGGGFVMVRPSGTEPKIKFYFSVRGKEPDLLEKTLHNVRSDLLSLVSKILGKPID